MVLLLFVGGLLKKGRIIIFSGAPIFPHLIRLYIATGHYYWPAPADQCQSAADVELKRNLYKIKDHPKVGF